MLVTFNQYIEEKKLNSVLELLIVIAQRRECVFIVVRCVIQTREISSRLINIMTTVICRIQQLKKEKSAKKTVSDTSLSFQFELFDEYLVEKLFDQKQRAQ